MRAHFVYTAIVTLLIICACGCGQNRSTSIATVPEFENDDRLILYSIDGKAYSDERLIPGKLPEGIETLHEFPVLGKVEIVDRQKRNELLSVLRLNMERG